MKKFFSLTVVLALTLVGCTGPSAGDLRAKDPEGDTACIHFGAGYGAGAGVGDVNMQKAAAHGAAASTEQIRQAVTVDSSGTPQIPDPQAFQKACEAEGFDFN